MGLPGRLAVQSVQRVPVPVGAVGQTPGAEGEPPGEGCAFQGLDLWGRGHTCVRGEGPHVRGEGPHKEKEARRGLELQLAV